MSTNLPVSVVVPVGPDPHYKDWLFDCLQSIRAEEPNEIIIIDDKANLDGFPFWDLQIQSEDYLWYYKNEWLLGCAHSWNKGVALAENDLVFLMGSDDKLLPGCLSACVEAYESNKKKAAWYNVTCELQSGELASLPNNAAAVTKSLWNLTGGFGVSAFSAPDAWLISILLKHHPRKIVQVQRGTPYYWVREHKWQDTKVNVGRFCKPTIQIRNIETRDWKQPTWTEKF